jgi:hypothetical protein
LVLQEHSVFGDKGVDGRRGATNERRNKDQDEASEGRVDGPAFENGHHRRRTFSPEATAFGVSTKQKVCPIFGFPAMERAGRNGAEAELVLMHLEGKEVVSPLN